MLVHYRGCDDLPIYNFNRVVETSDFRYLLIDFDEYSEELELDPDDHLALAELWEKIYKDYKSKQGSDSAEVYHYIELCSSLSESQTARAMIMELLDFAINKCKKVDVIDAYMDEISKWGVKFRFGDDLESKCKAVISHNKALETKIKVKQKQIEQMKPKGASVEFVEQLVSLESALEKNNIDPKTTSVSKWVAYLNQAVKKSELLNKIHGKGK